MDKDTTKIMKIGIVHQLVKITSELKIIWKKHWTKMVILNRNKMQFWTTHLSGA